MRLFFGLSPTQAARTRIDKFRSSLPGRAESTQNLHVTLLFLGEIDPSLVPTIEDLATTTSFHAFDLSLNRIRRWDNGILHLAPNTYPPALVELHDELKEGVKALGVAIEKRKYSPHLTLCRDSPGVGRMRCPAFSWRVEEFSLFSSEFSGGQVVYRPVRVWRAGGSRSLSADAEAEVKDREQNRTDGD